MDQIGKYIVLEEIGLGGMGVVYRAKDPVIGREVAVKVISERIMSSPDLRERFLREIASAGRLSHENIMTIYDAGDLDDRPYFVMELLDGSDLSAIIRHGSLSLDEKLNVAHQMARGLAYAHRRGVIHRDIKPDNIRLLNNGRVKIMDFGIARIESQTRTPTHTTIGSPRYMSPEQITGESVDQRTDIFSFGTVLYEMLNGRPPFTGDRITTIIYQVLNAEPDPIVLDSEGAEDVYRFVERCLKKDPDERFASFEDVLKDLRTIIIQRTGTASIVATLPKPPPPIEKTSPMPQGEKTMMMAPLPAPEDRAAESRSQEVTYDHPGEATDDRTIVYRPLAVPNDTVPPPTPHSRKIRWGVGAAGLLLVLLLALIGLASLGGDSDPVAQTATMNDAVVSDEDQPASGLEGSTSEDIDPLAGRNDEEDGAATDVEPDDVENEADTPAADAPEESDTDAREEARRREEQRAERARQGMERSRQQVYGRREEAGVTEAFQQAEALRASAARQMSREGYERAASGFEQARRAYAAIAQIPTPTPEPTPPLPTPDPPAAEAERVEPTPPPVAEPEPTGPTPEEEARAQATQTAQTLTSRLKQALEREDAGAMQGIHGFYDGWESFFRVAEDVEATVRTNSLEINGSRAILEVATRLQFRNTSTNSQESTNVVYVWTLEDRGEAWALASVTVR